MPVTVAIDALTAMHCPAVAEQAVKRGYEIVGHGQSVTRVISARMSEDEERQHIRTSLEMIEAACGKRPLGWHGPDDRRGRRRRSPSSACKYVLDSPNWTNS